VYSSKLPFIEHQEYLSSGANKGFEGKGIPAHPSLKNAIVLGVGYKILRRFLCVSN